MSRDRAYTRCRCCYNCAYGRFNRRHGSLVQAGRGWCHLYTGEPLYPKEWSPPKAFWTDLEEEKFEVDYVRFMDSNAMTYWGDKLYLERVYGGGLHIDMHKVRKEFGYMVWIAQHFDDMLRVSSQGTCQYHRYPEEAT